MHEIPFESLEQQRGKGNSTELQLKSFDALRHSERRRTDILAIAGQDTGMPFDGRGEEAHLRAKDCSLSNLKLR